MPLRGNALLLFTLVLLKSLLCCGGHEMCVNDTILIKLTSPLKFCTNSLAYGCCTKQYEDTISSKYHDIRWKFPEELEKKCSPYIREMLCHLCHPMSAHSFESGAKLEIPGLCPQYCLKFYNDCHQIIKYLGKNIYSLYLESQPKGAKSWCDKVQTYDKDYCFPDVLTNSKLFSGNIDMLMKSDTKECVCFKGFEDEATLPVKMQEIDDGSGRLFVAELPGIISVFHSNGTKEKVPFLNITDRISRHGKSKEMGLMSFIFHPSYKNNGKMYVIYAQKGRLTFKLQEFTMGSDYSIKNERELLKIQPPGRWHNLDDLLFGYDGYLYLFNGDGGIQADFFNLSQNSSVFFGKALRIDVDNISDEKPYAIPPDNPYINDEAFAPEIFAYGLRNPWRCTIDTGNPSTGENKGRILCGDVGQSGAEEINIIKKGGNYGWKKKEGYGCFRSDKCDDIPNEELPIYAYDHGKGKSVTGGEVYRGHCIPHLQGKYIFSDFMYGFIDTLEENNDGSWTSADLKVCNECPSPLTNNIPKEILSFGRDKKGEIYIMTTTKLGVQNTLPGYIYKIVHPDTYEWCPRDVDKKQSSQEKESNHETKKNLNTDVIPGEKSVHDENSLGFNESVQVSSITKVQDPNKSEFSTNAIVSTSNYETATSSFSTQNPKVISSLSSHVITSSSVYEYVTSSSTNTHEKNVFTSTSTFEITSSQVEVTTNNFIQTSGTTSSLSTGHVISASQEHNPSSKESTNSFAGNIPLLVILPTLTPKEATNMKFSEHDEGMHLSPHVKIDGVPKQKFGDINGNSIQNVGGIVENNSKYVGNGSPRNMLLMNLLQKISVMLLITCICR